MAKFETVIHYVPVGIIGNCIGNKPYQIDLRFKKNGLIILYYCIDHFRVPYSIHY